MVFATSTQLSTGSFGNQGRGQTLMSGAERMSLDKLKDPAVRAKYKAVFDCGIAAGPALAALLTGPAGLAGGATLAAALQASGLDLTSAASTCVDAIN